MSNYREASCRECNGKYELIPPADPDCSEPKENKTSDDCITRNYECDQIDHRNTIYWHKKEFLMSSDSSTISDDKPYASTKYSREQTG